MALYLGKIKISPIEVFDLDDDLNKELTTQEKLLDDLHNQVDELEEPEIMKQNINTYKYQDLTRALMTGTEMATDEEYIRAEEYLQSKYALIMGGNNV